MVGEWVVLALPWLMRRMKRCSFSPTSGLSPFLTFPDPRIPTAAPHAPGWNLPFSLGHSGGHLCELKAQELELGN